MTISPRRIVRPWTVTLALSVIYLAVILVHYGNGVQELIQPTITGSKGYDGQFAYFIAQDPATAPTRISGLGDVPAYRYQRILHPFLARVLGLGQPDLIPWAMVIINLAALAAGTAALEALLVAEKANRWFALTYGLFGGVFIAVRVSTTEPLAYGLVILSILAEQRKRPLILALCLGLAALAKETTLFFVAGYLAYYVLERRWKDAVWLGAVGILPFAAWQVVLRVWLGQFGIGSGGALATPFEIIPFNGIWRIAQVDVKVFVILGLVTGLEIVLPTLWGVWRSGRDVLKRQWHPYVFILLANAAIMPFVPFSTYREPLGIARFAVGLVISTVLYAALRRARRPLMYSTIWILFGILLLG